MVARILSISGDGLPAQEGIGLAVDDVPDMGGVGLVGSGAMASMCQPAKVEMSFISAVVLLGPLADII